MHSLAEPVRGSTRRRLEWLAHGVALALLAWLGVRSLAGAGAGPPQSAGSAALPAELSRWSTVDRPARVHALIDGDLSPVSLDWLAALARVGTPVSWEGSPVPVAAIDDPLADPGGGTRVRVAATHGAMIALYDAFGPLDSLAAGVSGATFLTRSGPPWVRARSGLLSARAATPDSPVFGKLLVLGRVDWESKFVVAALEERGWKVDARLALSPTRAVTQGPAVRLDTATYSALIVLDSVAPAELAAIPPYLRSGGGVILAARALRAPALGALGATRGTPGSGTEPFDTVATNPRSSLAVWPIAASNGQLTLESRAGQAALVARRVERGRLVIVGYQDTWRWRMSGRADAAEAHRDWWNGLVASVARVGRQTRGPSPYAVDEAPLVHLLDLLGPAASPAASVAGGLSISNGLLFGLLAALLLLEWTSRRLRGAP